LKIFYNEDKKRKKEKTGINRWKTIDSGISN